MSPETPHLETLNVPDDWATIQESIHFALRASLEEVARDQLAGAICGLLIRLAFAQFVRGAMADFQAAADGMELDSDPTAA